MPGMAEAGLKKRRIKLEPVALLEASTKPPGQPVGGAGSGSWLGSVGGTSDGG